MLPMLLSKNLQKKCKRQMLFGVGILLFILFSFMVYSISAHDYKNFWIIIIVILLILLFELIAWFLNYARTPAKLEKIDEVGFEYITVLGKKRRIRWEQIVEIQKFREYPDMGILYTTKTGKEGIEIRADVGEEIRRAWERWKKEQEVNR